MRTLGIVIIVVGLCASVFTGFTLITRKKIANIGKLEINRDENTPIYWSPVAGLIVLSVGVLIFLSGKKSK